MNNCRSAASACQRRRTCCAPQRVVRNHYAGLRRANVTMPQSPPVTPQHKVTPWLASNGLASQFRPVSPPVSRMPNPGSGRQWRHTHPPPVSHPVWWFPSTPPPYHSWGGIKIVDLAGQIEHRSMSSPQGESEKSEKELLSAANNPICRWMFSGVMV